MTTYFAVIVYFFFFVMIKEEVKKNCALIQVNDWVILNVRNLTNVVKNEAIKQLNSFFYI